MIWGPTLPAWGGGDPHSSFYYNSSPFHVDHWRALKVNKAHSLLRMSLWGHKGWKLIGRQARCPPLRQPVSTCFTCLLILVETMHFFFNWGRERMFRLFGNCWYLQESRYQYWYKIVVATCVSHYLCTWVGAHGIIYLTNQCHIFSYSASLISPSRMSLSSFGSWGYGGFQADFGWVLENLPDPL